jgi:hypothetical protein
MTDKPDLTDLQLQIMHALMQQQIAADIDPAEVGGLRDDELARHLGVTEQQIRDARQLLIDLGFIEYQAAQCPMADEWFRQVQCDWQWPDGRYCNMTVHFYALCAEPPQRGHADVEASLAGYCSLEHANGAPRPTLAAAQRLYEETVEGTACTCGHCPATPDRYGAKAIHKLLGAYPDPIAVTDVQDYEEKNGYLMMAEHPNADDPSSKKELSLAAVNEELLDKLWLVPVYDEHGRREEHNGQTRYILTPLGLDVARAAHPDGPQGFTPEEYAHLQPFLERALRFDPATRARYQRIRPDQKDDEPPRS